MILLLKKPQKYQLYKTPKHIKICQQLRAHSSKIQNRDNTSVFQNVKALSFEKENLNVFLMSQKAKWMYKPDMYCREIGKYISQRPILH